MKQEQKAQFEQDVDPDSDDTELRRMMHAYFQLEHDLEALYQLWAMKCSRMAIIIQHLPGVRVVRCNMKLKTIFRSVSLTFVFYCHTFHHIY